MLCIIKGQAWLPVRFVRWFVLLQVAGHWALCSWVLLQQHEILALMLKMLASQFRVDPACFHVHYKIHLLILRNAREGNLYLTFLPFPWFVIQIMCTAYYSRIFISRLQYLALIAVLCFLLDLCHVMWCCRQCEDAQNWPKPCNLSWCVVLCLYPQISIW